MIDGIVMSQSTDVIDAYTKYMACLYMFNITHPPTPFLTLVFMDKVVLKEYRENSGSVQNKVCTFISRLNGSPLPRRRHRKGSKAPKRKSCYSYTVGQYHVNLINALIFRQEIKGPYNYHTFGFECQRK